MTTSQASLSNILRPGDTCWRIERADRLAVIVDGADYFRAVRSVLLRASKTVYLVGWDFDLRIEMMPGESDEDGNAPDGLPNRLGGFLEAVVERNETVRLYLLKWDGAMLTALVQQAAPTLKLKLASNRIHFALDSHHPIEATHHQKVVVVDDKMAFCGGIDMTIGRWDTREHRHDDPRRAGPDGNALKPWHDVTTALEGPVAGALGDLARMRWRAATGEELDAIDTATSPWPDDLDPHLRGVNVGIARTQPRYHEQELVNEIERLYLAVIAAAEHTIYLESQYLAAGSICEALEERLAEPDGPEIVVVNPRNAQTFLEDEAMHSVRARMIERLRDAEARGRRDPDGPARFLIVYPANQAGDPIYVHAKVLIVDDRFVRVGSSNVNNRSMGFDTECDVAFEATTQETRERVRDLQASLLGEHMGCEPRDVADAIAREGSLMAAIEALNAAEGRGLRPIEPDPLDPLELTLAESRLFDPRTWPRNRPHPVGAVKHGAKRAVAPYHVEAVGTGGVLLAAGAAALGIWAFAAWRRRHAARRRYARGGFPAPALMTDGAPAPYRVPYRPDRPSKDTPS